MAIKLIVLMEVITFKFHPKIKLLLLCTINGQTFYFRPFIRNEHILLWDTNPTKNNFILVYKRDSNFTQYKNVKIRVIKQCSFIVDGREGVKHVSE